MNLLKLSHLKTFSLCCILFTNLAFSSDFSYTGPQLKLDYYGPVIVHNSQYKYTASDRLTFYTEDYLTQNIPILLPLREAIDSWAALHSIHPRLLSNVLNNYFHDKIVNDSFKNKQIVYQISAGLSQGFNQDKNDALSASKAVIAIAKAFQFELNLSEHLSTQRKMVEHDYFRGSSGPPLYGYFQPPWPRGELWSGGGVHTQTGSGTNPRNSLDFFESFLNWGDDTSNIWVSASEAGIARVFSTCNIQVIHPNGWISSYYHLDNVQVNNLDDVIDNQKLSNYADNLSQATCQGGSSTGPHVHFSIIYNGNDIEIDEPNVDFSSWKHQAGIGNYDSNCANSVYTLIPENTTVCPFFLQLPNNTTGGIIFANGFE